MVTKKLGGYLDNKRRFHSFGDTFEGYQAAEMRYGFDPKTKSKEFMKAYEEYTKQLDYERAKAYWEWKKATRLFS